jgi:hypothetical protein
MEGGISDTEVGVHLVRKNNNLRERCLLPPNKVLHMQCNETAKVGVAAAGVMHLTSSANDRKVFES